VVGGQEDLENSAGVHNCLGLSKPLVSRFELANDLFRSVPGSLRGEVPGPVWPDEDSQSPWNTSKGPRHASKPRAGGHNPRVAIVSQKWFESIHHQYNLPQSSYSDDDHLMSRGASSFLAVTSASKDDLFATVLV